jgi:hypothetical protein
LIFLLCKDGLIFLKISIILKINFRMSKFSCAFNVIQLFTMISGIGVFYPDGTKTQRTGIKIDRIVKPTVEGIRAGKNELLEEAINNINSNNPKAGIIGRLADGVGTFR